MAQKISKGRATSKAVRFTEHFNQVELFRPNKDGRILIDDPGMITILIRNLMVVSLFLELLRNHVSQVMLAETPFTITSGYRDFMTNRRVGGHPRSLHMVGLAVDFICGVKPCEFEIAFTDTLNLYAEMFKVMGITNISYYTINPESGAYHVQLKSCDPSATGFLSFLDENEDEYLKMIEDYEQTNNSNN
ncbi:peptidase M15 [Capybara microvirus Cap3_SP_293]|nr:peptidase M15 [Capybara microvirus Cap3_SP_293]